MRPKILTSVLVAVSTALTGCVDLPVVGNIGEQVKPMLPEFIREKLYPPEEAASSAARTATATPRRRGRKLNLAADVARNAGNAAGDAEAAPAAPRENIAVVYEQYLTRNMEFDHLRTQGIDYLIGGQTDKAIVVFKQALAKKPGDKSTEDLLHLAENPPVNRSLDGGPLVGGAPGNLPPGVPVLPSN
jgi:hypothetical protein